MKVCVSSDSLAFSGFWMLLFKKKKAVLTVTYDLRGDGEICLLWQWSCDKKFLSCCWFLHHDPVHCYLNGAAITVGGIVPYTWFVYRLSSLQTYGDEG